MRAEKRKWDRRLSSVGPARMVTAPGDAVAWYVAAGSERTLPSKNSTEVVARHELWVAVPGDWWVLCGEGSANGEVESYVLHAAAPFRRPTADLISWIDLDLDYEVSGDVVALEDEAQFHAHAAHDVLPRRGRARRLVGYLQCRAALHDGRVAVRRMARCSPGRRRIRRIVTPINLGVRRDRTRCTRRRAARGTRTS